MKEIILLIYRNLYEKLGRWSRKHKDRIRKLTTLSNFDQDEFGKVIDMIFKK